MSDLNNEHHFQNEPDQKVILPAKTDEEVILDAAAVELGEFGERKNTEVRYLMGRARLSPFIVSSCILQTLALAGALFYSLQNNEWSIIMVLLAWLLTFIWLWFYTISYTYRRRINYLYSTLIYTFYTSALAYFCFERALPQRVFTSAGLVQQGLSFELVLSGVFSGLAAVFILSHALYFGRGYRIRR